MKGKMVLLALIFICFKINAQSSYYYYYPLEAPLINLAVNGTMELNSNWTAFLTEAGDEVEQSTAESHSGEHSWRLLTDPLEGVISENISLIAGVTYVWTFWVKFESLSGGDGNIVGANMYAGNEDDAGNKRQNISTTNWTKVSWERTAISTGEGKFWLFQAGGDKMNMYIDDVIVYKK